MDRGCWCRASSIRAALRLAALCAVASPYKRHLPGLAMAFTLEMKNTIPDDQSSLDALEAAAALIYRSMPPTPQYRWPLLEMRVGTTVWVKHENHAPTGAFKVRGGLVYLEDLCRTGVKPDGVISATRGNHGQSVGFAARQRQIQRRPRAMPGDAFVLSM